MADLDQYDIGPDLGDFSGESVLFETVLQFAASLIFVGLVIYGIILLFMGCFEEVRQLIETSKGMKL